MITLKIDNPEMERVFYEDFNGDNDSFVEFLSESCHVNNVEYVGLDAKIIERLYDEGEDSADSGLTHEELWEKLFNKYDKN